jgi:hypothetical protein
VPLDLLAQQAQLELTVQLGLLGLLEAQEQPDSTGQLVQLDYLGLLV